MVDGINNSPAVSLERFDLSQLRVRGAVRTFRKRVYLPRRYVVVFHVYEVWSPFSRIPLSNTGRWIAQRFLLILTLAVATQKIYDDKKFTSDFPWAPHLNTS